MSDQAGQPDRESGSSLPTEAGPADGPSVPEDAGHESPVGEADGAEAGERSEADEGSVGEGAAGENAVGEGSADESSADEGKGEGKKKRPFWREFAVILVAALVLTILLKAFVVEVFSIPSGSMENTLQVGDRVLVNKLVYHFRDIARGDVIVFSGNGSWGPVPAGPSNPVSGFFHDVLDLVGLQSDGTDYIKRVIGVPGDHVACCDPQGRVTVNGVPLSERSYVHPGDPPSELRFSVTVPPGRLWVMGDNRSDSADSRFHLSGPGHGTIPKSAVVGRASWIIWPVSRLGDLPIPASFATVTTKTGAMVLGNLPVAGAFAGIAIVTRRRRRRR